VEFLGDLAERSPHLLGALRRGGIAPVGELLAQILAERAQPLWRRRPRPELARCDARAYGLDTLACRLDGGERLRDPIARRLGARVEDEL